MKQKLRLTLVILAVALSACSKHWRNGDSGIADTDLNAAIQDSMAQINNTNGIVPQTDVDRFNTLLNDPNTSIYYAESGPSMGPALNLASFFDWSFMGDQALQQNGAVIDPIQLDHVRVIFLDSVTQDGQRNALFIDVTSQGRRTVKLFFNDMQDPNLEPSSIDKGEFVSQMVASDGAQIVVRSLDVTGDLLQGVIQLEIYDFLNGEETFTGKFTTLVGYLAGT